MCSSTHFVLFISAKETYFLISCDLCYWLIISLIKWFWSSSSGRLLYFKERIERPVGRIESLGDDNETAKGRRKGIGPVDGGWDFSVLLKLNFLNFRLFIHWPSHCRISTQGNFIRIELIAFRKRQPYYTTNHAIYSCQLGRLCIQKTQQRVQDVFTVTIYKFATISYLTVIFDRDLHQSLRGQRMSHLNLQLIVGIGDR